MNNEQKQTAKELFFQTDLTKTQIADTLGISRRSLTYWIREGDWTRLKIAARHLPSILAENIYHMIGHLTEYYLSESRITNPITIKEADTLHKLALTVSKLKNRSTLNESMEMFGFFMDALKKKKPELAQEVAPHIEEYIASRAAIYVNDVMPSHFTDMGRIPWESEEAAKQRLAEQLLDARENIADDHAACTAAAEAAMQQYLQKNNPIHPAQPTNTDTMPPSTAIPSATAAATGQAKAVVPSNTETTHNDNPPDTTHESFASPPADRQGTKLQIPTPSGQPHKTPYKTLANAIPLISKNTKTTTKNASQNHKNSPPPSPSERAGERSVTEQKVRNFCAKLRKN